MFGHSEIVTDGVVFGDGTTGNPEPVGLRGSKSPSVRRKRVGHSSVGRVMHHKRSVLTGVQSDTGNCAVSRDKHFMKFEAHIGKGPVKPADRSLKSFRFAPASFHRLVHATVVEEIGGHIRFCRLEISAGCKV